MVGIYIYIYIYVRVRTDFVLAKTYLRLYYIIIIIIIIDRENIVLFSLLRMLIKRRLIGAGDILYGRF